MRNFSDVRVICQRLVLTLQSEFYFELMDHVGEKRKHGWIIENPPRYVGGKRVWQTTLSCPNENKEDAEVVEEGRIRFAPKAVEGCLYWEIDSIQ